MRRETTTELSSFFYGIPARSCRPQNCSFRGPLAPFRPKSRDRHLTREPENAAKNGKWRSCRHRSCMHSRYRATFATYPPLRRQGGGAHFPVKMAAFPIKLPNRRIGPESRPARKMRSRNGRNGGDTTNGRYHNLSGLQIRVKPCSGGKVTLGAQATCQAGRRLRPCTASPNRTKIVVATSRRRENLLAVSAAQKNNSLGLLPNAQ